MIRIKALILFLLLCEPLIAQETDFGWIKISNKKAQPALKLLAKYNPELAGRYGVDGFDEAILDLGPGSYERRMEESRQLIRDLTEAINKEQHPKVRQDLNILRDSVTEDMTGSELEHRLMLPFHDVAAIAFQGVNALLADNVADSRYPAAVERLKKYAGLGDEQTPLAELARARTTERLDNPELTGPYRREVSRSIANSEQLLDGIAALMKKYKLTDWEDAHAELVRQVKDYNTWVESTVLPRARTNNRLPAELYAHNLKQYGVSIDPHELIERAQSDFTQIRSEMNALGKRIATENGWEINSYRDVIRELKKDQIKQNEILDVYYQRLAAIEEIIRSEDIVSLPVRKARIRFATGAESARIPVPSMRAPRLIGNTGEYGEFLIPLRNPNAESDDKMDDFFNHAISWSLTAHEARPGHEMQYSSIVESGVSLPRALFAANSANIEGWGMYSEAIMKEHFPLEGQFSTLRSRLTRTARAFLDPMVNLGLLEPHQVKHILMRDLLLSEPLASSEVDRYTFRAPGQATSYYFGLMKMEALRTRAEILLGGKFNQRAFHDFILRQGPLPPDLLAEAVMEEFIYKTKKQRRLTGESSKVSSLEPIPSWKFSCKTSATYKQRPTTFSVPSVTAG